MKIRKKTLPFLILFSILLFLGNRCDETVKSNYRSFESAEELQAYLKWHPGKEPLISAHRGGPEAGFPENAIETFENVLRYGPCLIECDVRISKDGHLVMMHDETLDRTTTGSGKVSDHTLAELKELFLKDNNNKPTTYRIPTFAEVLQWAVERTVLTVDVKRDVSLKQIVSEIREHKAEGHAVVIVYNHEDLLKVHRLAPDLMISASALGIMGVKALLSADVPAVNICAFVGVYEPPRDVYEMLHQKGISTILVTSHNLDNKAAARGIRVYQELYRNGADILSTDNVPLVSKAIKEL
jgi:glycerophosphoryl diester phosphodiesterase